MRNVNVEKEILLALNDRPVGAKMHTLQSEVENNIDNCLLTDKNRFFRYLKAMSSVKLLPNSLSSFRRKPCHPYKLFSPSRIRSRN